MSFNCIYCIVLIFVGSFHVESKSNKKILLSWQEITSCPNYENKHVDISTMKIYMANETTVRLKGFLDIKIDLDKPTPVTAIVEKEVGGGNYMSVLNYEADLCRKIDGSDKDWSMYINALKPVPTKCPMAKNKYDVSDVQPQTTNFELKKDMVGKYKSTIKMFREEKSALPSGPKMWFCFQLNFEVDIAE